MIYSRWRPDVGGYDYFEDARTLNVNDDLDTPSLPRGSGASASFALIGVPSIECGRRIPSDAVHVGEGLPAVGVIAPVDPAKLVRRTRSLAGLPLPSTAKGYVLAALALYGAGFIAYRIARRRRR